MLAYVTFDLDDIKREKIEFPNKEGIEWAKKDTDSLFRNESLEKDSLVKVIKAGSNFEVLCGIEIYLGKLNPTYPGPFLGELKVSAHPTIFKKLLNRYGRSWKGKTQKDKFWEIEYGLLLSAYQCYKRNPKELEDIMKVAKTKKDLKIHLGVS